MICFPTVFDFFCLGTGGLLPSLKFCLTVANEGPVEDGEGGDSLAGEFFWLVLNLDTCTLGVGDWKAPSPGLGDTAGNLEGDPGDGVGEGGQGERRAAPGLANGMRRPKPTDGFGAPGFDGGHRGRGVVEAGPGGPCRRILEGLAVERLTLCSPSELSH